MKQLLIVDDDVAVTNYLMVFLMQTEKYETFVINDSREVAPLLGKQSFDVMLLDMDMPNVSGIDVLKHLRAAGIATPVIILTGVSDVDLAVRSLKLGAFDYLTKPVDEEKLLGVIEAALEHRALHHTIEQMPQQLKREDLTHKAAFENFPTQHSETIRLLHQAEKMASSDLTIFIRGEIGSGKLWLARAIHQASPRCDQPFVAIAADAVDPAELPAQFFGQARLWSGEREERPGFLEEAQGGTLYMDKIGRLSGPMQMRIKRLLQTGEYYRENSTRILKANVRFILASTRDLEEEPYRTTFSRDLYYHLMVNSIVMPPLRERKDDLPILADVFLKEAVSKTGKPIAGIAPQLISFLRTYDFPDNMQELRNIIEGSVANTDSAVLTVDSLPAFIRSRIESPGIVGTAGFRPRPLRDVVREHVRRTFEFCSQDKLKTAAELEISLEELEGNLR